MRALEAVGQHRKLERLSVTLRGIKLVQLPAQVESLPQLHSLELRYDPQVGRSNSCLLCGLHERALFYPKGDLSSPPLIQCSPRLPLLYNVQLRTLLLPLAVGDTRGALPPTLRHLLLDSPPLRSEAAVELASKLPLLQSFQLVRR